MNEQSTHIFSLHCLTKKPPMWCLTVCEIWKTTPTSVIDAANWFPQSLTSQLTTYYRSPYGVFIEWLMSVSRIKVDTQINLLSLTHTHTHTHTAHFLKDQKDKRCKSEYTHTHTHTHTHTLLYIWRANTPRELLYPITYLSTAHFSSSSNN